jgi:hypothetical protein
MRKKCVLWAKPVLVVLTIIIAAGVHWSDSALSAQSPNPLTLPRLGFSDITYLGGFRLPNTAQGGDFSYGGNQMAYNPARNSLFVNSLHYKVAEVTIPAPVNTSDVSRMSFASYLQPFSDPSEGHLDDIGPGTVMGGLLVHGDRLYSTGYVYYDGLNTQVTSHFSHSTNLSEPSFRGMSQVWETGKAGFVAGYMANIPAQWQSLLGGPALTGQCCIPLVTRTSFGPSAFGFDPAGIGANTALPASPLLYYTKEHASLGPWEGATAMYGGATMMGGAAVIAGTRTALFIGRIGTTFCYGYGVEDPALHGTRGAFNQTNCYDPWNLAKGTHGYPYKYQIWAYDLADFAAVKAGAKQPWDVVPYAVWPFTFPTAEKKIEIGGIAYDAQRQLLYVSQSFADLDGCCERRPIIHTLKLNAPSTIALAPTVSLTPNAAAPQAPGKLIRWSAAASGGIGPYEYKWSVRANGGWSVLRDWSASTTLDWQPAVVAADTMVAVSVRSTGGTVIAATAEYPYAIVDAATLASFAPASSLTLTSNLPAPQPTGSSIVWTATPAGGSGPMVYKWFVYELGLWRPVGAWASSNQLRWTPTSASADYRVSAWVKRATSTADEADATSERPFAITASPSAPAPPPASAPAPIATRVASLAVAANLPAPQQAGSTIVWTATPTGGTGALVYKWFVYELGLWRPVGSWTASNQFSWTPTKADPAYRVSAWVKHAANAAEEVEASAERPFAITASSAPTPTPPPTSARVASLALTTNVPAPQPAASTIVWTATPTGGSSTLLYKWFVYELGLWRPVGTWTASNQFSWTPTKADAAYRVSAWVKSAATAADEAEATSERPFAITASTSAPAPTPAPTSTRVASLALTTNVPAPQPAASTIVWTATPTGGSAALLYKWFVYELGLWRPVGTWTASNQFSWTPTKADAAYRVSAWVKRAATAADEAEATSERPFAITASTSAPAPPPASAPAPIATRVASLAVAANLPAPQQAGSTIVWTATPTGGTGALVYKWFVYELGLWRPVGSWTASNQFSWTPTKADAAYRVSAWVKHAANAAEEVEASAERPFAITASTSAPAPAPVPTSARVASLALTTNVPAPQRAGSTIVWTATPTGGSSTLLYKWFVYELGLWRPVGTWTASNQFSWAPTKADAAYRVSAWVKSAATAADEAEATSERPFAITASTSAPAPTSTSTRVASLALTTNVPAPQRAGSTIVWTATPTGGSAALLYKWFVYELGLWRPVGTWTASNQFSWTPTKADAAYRVSAWVKSAATAADEAEATSERPFAITTP